MGDIFEYYRARASWEGHSSIPSSYQRRLESMPLHVILDQRESLPKCELRIHALCTNALIYLSYFMLCAVWQHAPHTFLLEQESMQRIQARQDF